MSPPGVSRWAKAIKQFWKQQTTLGKETVKLVGQDHLGNKYFEAKRPNHSRPLQRYFDRENKQNLDDVVDLARVPPQWDAWLRFRRQDPPTKEEIKDSEDYFQMQQEMASKRKESEQDAVNNQEKSRVPKVREMPTGRDTS